MIRDRRLGLAADLRRARRRRRHLRPDDRVRRGAARPVGRAHRARRLRQRRVVQPPADDPRRPALPADARPRAARANRSASGARSRGSRRTRSAPLPFVLPLYRSLAAGKLAMRAGFLLDRLVALRPQPRRAAVAPAAGRPRRLARHAAIQRFPGLRRQGLTGAAVWYDYVTTEADRLTFAWALAAAEHGAVLANHVEATALLVDGQARGRRPRARRAEPDATLEIGARVTVNATGGAVDRLLDAARAVVDTGPDAEGDEPRHAPRRRRRGARRPIARRGAICSSCRGASGRCSAPGSPARTCEPDDTAVTEARGRGFIAELNQAFPSLDLTLADVTLVHRGRRAGGRLHGGRVVARGTRADPRPRGRWRRGAGERGGHEVHDRARRRRARDGPRCSRSCGTPPVPCRTATTPLPGGDLRDIGAGDRRGAARARRGLPTDTIPHLVAAYGSRYRDVLELAADRPDWRDARSRAGSPVIGAELVWAVRRRDGADAGRRGRSGGRRSARSAIRATRRRRAAAAIVGARARLDGPTSGGRAPKIAARVRRVLRSDRGYGSVNALNT